MKSLLAAALVIVWATSALAADEAVDQEIKKWQGAWRAVSMEYDGKPTPPQELAKIKLTVSGAAYHFQNGDINERGTYRFDPSRNPKALDIVVGEGPDKGKVYLVIYKVEEDKLTICLEKANTSRPREFSGKVGSGCVLEVWQRVKP